MFTLKRITTAPGTALHIMVDQPEADSPDAGLTVGGSFWFEPAGQDGDTCGMSEHAARVIMLDPGLAVHFTCTPPLPGMGQEGQDQAAAPKAPKGRTKDSGGAAGAV